MIIESFFLSLFATDLTMLNVKNTVNWFHLCTLPILLISPTLSHADSTTVAFKAWSRYLQNGKDVVKTVDVKWPAEKTAVVICDMWSSHWCDSASRRCAEMAPRINAFVICASLPGVSSLFIAPVPA